MSATREPGINDELLSAATKLDHVPLRDFHPVAPPPAEPTLSAGALRTAVSIQSGFRFGEVRPLPLTPNPSAPPLGPLAKFQGDFAGRGFNTIFRPDGSVTPTPLPNPASDTPDNILELNLTQETLSFSQPLGSVPNRGFVQGDAFLNGVPYLQSISDLTSGQSIGIHLEPGLWIIVPPTADPQEGSTVVRMASIPHGTTINAQGSFTTFNGPPTISAADITPFLEGNRSALIRFPSQTASNEATHRVPQDLSAFVAAGTITQAMLDDPNSVLRAAIEGQHIVQTTAISISTAPASPLFGGGTDNIAFLWGNAGAVNAAHPAGQNAQAAEMSATFWIEEVEHSIVVGPFSAGQAPSLLRPEPAAAGAPVPTFQVIRPPVTLAEPRTLTITSTQIQYTQTVMLNFNGLSWPHVSVATLVPAGPIPLPPAAWE